MTKKLFLLLVSSILVFNAEAVCLKKRKKKHKSHTEAESTKPSNTLVVSFISKASGIDRLAAQKLVEEIKAFNDQNPTSNVVAETRSWGREGERDYCITAKNQTYLDKFAAIIKVKFKDNNRIFVTENGVCKEKRN